MTATATLAETRPIPAQVRYVNAEWKARAEIPRIGSRETRRQAWLCGTTSGGRRLPCSRSAAGSCTPPHGAA